MLPKGSYSSQSASGLPRASPTYSIQRLLHMASGYRHRETGAMTNVGAEGDLWSSSPNVSGNHNAGNLNFNAGNVNPLNGTNRANGLSVRCVQVSTGRPLLLTETAFLRPGVAGATASVSAVGRFSNPPPA